MQTLTRIVKRKQKSGIQCPVVWLFMVYIGMYYMHVQITCTVKYAYSDVLYMFFERTEPQNLQKL